MEETAETRELFACLLCGFVAGITLIMANSKNDATNCPTAYVERDVEMVCVERVLDLGALSHHLEEGNGAEHG